MQMNTWSTKLGSSAQFLCICVETMKIAVLFRQFTGTSMNALMDPSAPPTFPAQLGCQGFVIIDAEGKFITTRSASFLELSDAAFLDVERKLLEAGQAQLSSLSPDTVVFQPSSATRDSSPSESKETFPAELYSLPRVGYADMDAEHEKITAALSDLLKAPSLKKMEIVKNEFYEHSESEEALLEKLGFGDGGALSALKSHADDHARIIALMDDALKNASLSPVVINTVVAAIYQHVEKFDILYAVDESIDNSNMLSS